MINYVRNNSSKKSFFDLKKQTITVIAFSALMMLVQAILTVVGGATASKCEAVNYGRQIYGHPCRHPGFDPNTYPEYINDRRWQKNLFNAAHAMGVLAIVSALLMGLYILFRGITTRSALKTGKDGVQRVTPKLVKKPCCTSTGIGILSSIVALLSTGISIAIPFLVKHFEDDLCEKYGFVNGYFTNTGNDYEYVWRPTLSTKRCYAKPERIELGLSNAIGFFISLSIVSVLVTVFTVLYSKLLKKWKKATVKEVALSRVI